MLLPRAQLPLHVQESKYRKMIDDALNTHCLIGLVQPHDLDDPESKEEYFKSGSLGRIISSNDLEEDHRLLVVTGVSRFEIIKEIHDKDTGYTQATVDYSRYGNDLVEEVDLSIDRNSLLSALQTYLKDQDVSPDWDEISKVSNEKLITALTMVCPFDARERQALLESPTLQDQSQVMTTLLEMASMCPEHETMTRH